MKLKDIASVQMAQEYIEAHLHEDILLKTLCEKFGVGREKLQKLFKALLNDTVYEYVRKQKLRYGAERLLNTDDSVQKIAQDVAYCKSNFFIRFKAEYNCTPDEFRMLYRILPEIKTPEIHFPETRAAVKPPRK